MFYISDALLPLETTVTQTRLQSNIDARILHFSPPVNFRWVTGEISEWIFRARPRTQAIWDDSPRGKKSISSKQKNFHIHRAAYNYTRVTKMMTEMLKKESTLLSSAQYVCFKSPLQYKLFKKSHVSRTRANFFSERVVNSWNFLPDSVDFSSPSIQAFHK